MAIRATGDDAHGLVHYEFIPDGRTLNKQRAITVTCLGGLQGCEMSRILHCLDNRLTDGGKVVSPLYPQETLYFCFWYSFLLEAE
jgi:hypothetical protein